MRILVALSISVGLFGFAELCAAPISAADATFFEKEIRPVLLNRMNETKTVESGKSKGGLLLDSRQGWEVGGDSGPAIVPGKADESLLIRAIRYGDPDLEMPPKGLLPSREMDALTRWVERGAPDPRDGQGVPVEAIDYEMARASWPYKPPEKIAPPNVPGDDWSRTPVDRFIHHQQIAKELEPVADASPQELIRRATFDLTGLPPTPEEMDDFLEATRTNPEAAWTALVNRLLDSSAFGERWARYWLDVARYADSSGGGRDILFKESWRYRDYVIKAFNADKPYGEFITEQIAGDLIEKPTADSLTATGFLVLAPTNYENQDKAALDLDVADEQIDTIGRAFMGMTVGCARCHDHMFDPISIEDYTALAGIFMSTKSLSHANVSQVVHTDLPGYDAMKAEMNTWQGALDRKKKKLGEAKKALKKLQAGSASLPALQGILVDEAAAEVKGFWKPSTSIPGYIGGQYIHDNYDGKGEKWVRFRPEIPKAGRYDVQISYTPSGNRSARVPVEVVSGGKTFSHDVNQKRVPEIRRTFHSLGVYDLEAGTNTSVTIYNRGTREVVIADAARFVAVDAKPTPEEVKPKGRDAETAAKIAALKEDIRVAERAIKAFGKTRPPGLPRVMSVGELDKPADLEMRIRGMAHNKGKAVKRGFLPVLDPAETPPPELAPDASGRLEFARWLTRADHPLTTRVWVNRVWQNLFGIGIVRSPDNFGKMGVPPSHPELLDWLAVTFTESGGSTKELIRQLMHSRTYRLSTDFHEENYRRDPENWERWRQHRKRLEAECLHDAMLQIAGVLTEDGGPAFPKGLANARAYQPDGKRRLIYHASFRNQLIDIAEVFDAANANMVSGKRSTSTLATQALFFMNNPRVATWAAAAADRIEAMGLAPEDRVAYTFRLVLGREPTAAEREKSRAFLEAGEGSAADFIQLLFASIDFRYVQ